MGCGPTQTFWSLVSKLPLVTTESLIYFLSTICRRQSRRLTMLQCNFLRQAWMKGRGLLTSSLVLASLQLLNLHRQYIDSEQAPVTVEDPTVGSEAGSLEQRDCMPQTFC